MQTVIYQHLQLPLTQITASLPRAPVNMKQILSQPLRIIRAQKPCRQIIQRKSIIFFLTAKGTLCAIHLSTGRKFHTSTISSTLPGLIVPSLIFQKRPPCGGFHSIQHRLDKCRHGGFSPAILTGDRLKSIRKIHLYIMQFSKIRNLYPSDLHAMPLPSVPEALISGFHPGLSPKVPSPVLTAQIHPSKTGHTDNSLL